MEWVETTAATIEEAKNLALDQLGIAEDDAEFEVIDEPKQGLFGRTRGEARVRARIRPTSPRAKNERRERGAKSASRRPGARPADEPRPRRESSTRPPRERKPRAERPDTDDDGARQDRADQPKVEAATVSAAAATFLEGILKAAGLTGNVVATIDNDDIDIQVNGDDLNVFVGQRGATLMAVQDLTRVVSQRRLGDHETHLRVDMGSYRERRREALGRFSLKVAAEVLASGEPRALEAMNSADRKIIHDTLADAEGIATRSEGEDPQRRVVVVPA